MTTYIARHAAATVIWKTAEALQSGAHALHRAAERIDQWLVARANAREDREALRAMSEHELRDIGLRATHVDGRSIRTLGDWPG